MSKQVIKVTKNQLEEIRDCLEGGLDAWERHGYFGINGGDFCAACYYGFPGFAGGLDHVERSERSITIVDRGMSGAGGYRDNTTKFVVA